MLEALFGLRAATGTVELSGEPFDLASPRASIEAGIGYLPPDRKTQALNLGMSVSDNLTAIQTLFARCPELTGFSVQAKVLADAPNTSVQEELFVTAISIAPRLSKEQYADIFEQISTILAELIAERPEAQTLLQGRTFARVIH